MQVSPRTQIRCFPCHHIADRKTIAANQQPVYAAHGIDVGACARVAAAERSLESRRRLTADFALVARSCSVFSRSRDPDETCGDLWPAISPRVAATAVVRPTAVVMPVGDNVQPRRRPATGDTPGPVAITLTTCHSVTSSRPPCPWPTAAAARQLIRSPGTSRSTGRVLNPVTFCPPFSAALPVALPRCILRVFNFQERFLFRASNGTQFEIRSEVSVG